MLFLTSVRSLRQVAHLHAPLLMVASSAFHFLCPAPLHGPLPLCPPYPTCLRQRDVGFIDLRLPSSFSFANKLRPPFPRPPPFFSSLIQPQMYAVGYSPAQTLITETDVFIVLVLVLGIAPGVFAMILRLSSDYRSTAILPPPFLTQSCLPNQFHITLQCRVGTIYAFPPFARRPLSELHPPFFSLPALHITFAASFQQVQ